MISKAVQTADLDAASALEALRRLNANCLEHRELIVFFMHHKRDNTLSSQAIADWEKQIDAFFCEDSRRESSVLILPRQNYNQFGYHYCWE